ncbi:MAG: DUF4386 domain-containing protein [Steroidobacteraceae bacterium]
MRPLKKTARIAGLWYLCFTLGPVYLLYVPSRTVVHNDDATATRILAHETLFRWGMLTETLGAVIFAGLALALYRLFEGVDRHRARELVALVLISSVVGLIAVLFNAAVLPVFSGGGPFAAVDAHTRQTVRMLLIRIHDRAFLAPGYTDSLFRYLQPVFMAELAAMLWLLIIGAREQPLSATTTAS